MANLPEVSQFDSVYQLERNDPVDAGVAGAGVSNKQAVNLTNRTKYLFDSLAAILAGSSPLTGSPAQFDDSLNIATTAWVNANQGRYVGVLAISQTTNLALQAVDAGKLCYWRGASGGAAQIGTMPSLSAVPPGACYHMQCEGSLLSLSAQTGEKFYIADPAGSYPHGFSSSGASTIYLHKRDHVVIFRSENNTVLGSSTPYWGVIVVKGYMLQAGEIFNSFYTNPGHLGLKCDGSLQLRSAYPRLWQFVSDGLGLGVGVQWSINEASWQIGPEKSQTLFSTGTITTGSSANFRMPLIPDIVTPTGSWISYYCRY